MAIAGRDRSDLDTGTLLVSYTALAAVLTVPLGSVIGAGVSKWETVFANESAFAR
jgi:hypothetical protein